MNKILIIITFVFTIITAQDCCNAEQIAIDECSGIGCYIPQCTDECEWEVMQCWSSTGYCWCVDEDGVEIEGTSTPSWQGYPDCQNQNNCIDGEINLDNPCNPMECFNGEWIEIIIDCAEDFGIPCEGGIYISPPEDQCCSDCISYGDINMDTSVDVLDAIDVVNLILFGEYNELVDMNFDNTLNVLDLIEIIDRIINIILE